MSPIDGFLEDLLRREGGFVNDPRDAGGATNFGITERVARANGFAGDMRGMTREQAKVIYRSEYWFKPHFDQIALRSESVAAELFDTGVNMGVETAGMFLQRSLTALNRAGKDFADLRPDGRIGPVTIAALVAFLNVRGTGPGEVVLLRALNGLQAARYIELSERREANENFLFGWLLNRIGAVA